MFVSKAWSFLSIAPERPCGSDLQYAVGWEPLFKTVKKRERVYGHPSVTRILYVSRWGQQVPLRQLWVIGSIRVFATLKADELVLTRL